VKASGIENSAKFLAQLTNGKTHRAQIKRFLGL